jgi:predicted metal-dependent hydrolase
MFSRIGTGHRERGSSTTTAASSTLGLVQLGLPFRLPSRPPISANDAVVTIAGHAIQVTFVRHRRARHYILRVDDNGRLRVTIPRAGSRAGALRFVHERRPWIERERYRRAVATVQSRPWTAGTVIPLRGEETRLDVVPLDARRVRVTFADHAFTAPAEAAANLRPHVERELRKLADRELRARLGHLAALHGFSVSHTTIRAQRSRWGSCSRTGRISLNWRLIQFPPRVSDYVLLHELAHIRHPNHSARFWRDMARLCPGYQEARMWLRHHGENAAENT